MKPIKRKRDWTTLLINVGLWGIAVLLTLPYIIAEVSKHAN